MIINAKPILKKKAMKKYLEKTRCCLNTKGFVLYRDIQWSSKFADPEQSQLLQGLRDKRFRFGIMLNLDKEIEQQTELTK
jgi:hypothetical protein